MYIEYFIQNIRHFNFQPNQTLCGVKIEEKYRAMSLKERQGACSPSENVLGVPNGSFKEFIYAN